VELGATEVGAVVEAGSTETIADFFRRREPEDFCLASRWLMSLSLCSEYPLGQCPVFVQYNMGSF